MRQKQEALTYVEVLNKYFGGVNGLARQGLPFTCSCGNNYSNIFKNGETTQKYIMALPDIWEHVRKTHREKIKRLKVEKEPEQTTI